MSEPPRLADFVEATTAHTLESWQRIVCAELEGLTAARGARLLIHGPPQYGKSLIISQRFPAWALSINPLLRMRTACYNVSHAERFTKVNLELLRDPQVTAMFGNPGAAVPAICPADEWSTVARSTVRDANPSMKALGLGSGFTGLGVDILVVDDPYKNAQEARSAATNLMLRDWWQNVVVPRLNPATNVVVMFHRWWEGDFAGWLMAQDGWRTLRFPAIADEETRFGHDPTGRAPGDLLSPRFSREWLDAQRLAMGAAFDALYQGAPYPLDGGMFSRAVDVLPATPPDIILRVRYWDKSGARAGKGDWTAGVLVAYRACGRVLVEDVERFQAEPGERNRRIRETAARDTLRPGARVVHIVEQPPGDGVEATQALIRALIGYPVFADPVRGDKVSRAEPFAAQWQVGAVDLLAGAWASAFLDELRAFPNGKHDDQADAASGAFNRLVEMLEARPPALAIDDDAPRVTISPY